MLAFFGRVIPRLRSFRIDVHDILASDAHVVVLVSYEHERDDRRFQQLGTEVFHLDENGQIEEFVNAALGATSIRLADAVGDISVQNARMMSAQPSG